MVFAVTRDKKLRKLKVSPTIGIVGFRGGGSVLPASSVPRVDHLLNETCSLTMPPICAFFLVLESSKSSEESSSPFVGTCAPISFFFFFFSWVVLEQKWGWNGCGGQWMGRNCLYSIC